MTRSEYNWGKKTYVMGILNVTPDSFSRDGILAGDDTVRRAIAQARQFVDAGVDVIDIGAESTRPGGMPVTESVELSRLLPVLRAVRRSVDVTISVDTYRSQVAERALEEGADWVNDVWGMRMDPKMAQVVAQAGCHVVIMHNRSPAKNAEQISNLAGLRLDRDYDNLLEDILTELQVCVDIALAAGVDRSRIIVDPGIGFGKKGQQNLEIIRRLDHFKELGYPILVGPSRKSFIGEVLGLPPEARVEGTAAVVAIAIDRGADIVRVHDVVSMVRVAKMTDRLVRTVRH